MEKTARLILRTQTGAAFPDKKGTVSGITYLKGQKVFFKILPKKLYKKELKGYAALKNYYPVSRIIEKYLGREKGIIFFEFDKTIKANKGLLMDCLKDDDLLNKFQKILLIYRKNFLKTLRKIDQSADEIFYKDRIETRVEKYYSDAFWSQFQGKKLKLNQQAITIDIQEITKSLYNFFNNKLSTWGVISQGDPLDPNISVKPTFFDYQTGGYNYLMSEFANMFWSSLVMGDYSAPIYHPQAFINHEKFFSSLNNCKIKNGNLLYQPKEIRRKMIENYIDEVINPCLQKIEKQEIWDWYWEFKHFIAMRIIAVLDLRKMRKIDQLLSLAYLQIFFDSKVTDPKELVKLLWP